MLDLLSLALFMALLVFAACSDVATMTIPNWISIALAAAFLPVAVISGMQPSDIAWHLGFGVLVLAGGFALFLTGILGGGDAKLIAAAAVWTGLSAFGPFAFWTVMAGGALATALFFARLRLKPADNRPAFLNRLLRGRGGVPYGVAIMTGGLSVLGALPFAARSLTLP
jgi:prepilin peptidase CpaA